MYDLIVTWPSHCDYPVFRDLIHQYRRLFDDVFVAFTEANQKVNRLDWIMETMRGDRIEFIKPRSLGSGDDWRNIATKDALAQSHSQWVLFIEQDFLIHKPQQFFYNLNQNLNKYDVIGFKEGERLHPGFMLIQRKALDRTCLDFGIVPNKLDHFGLITKDIEKFGLRVGILDEIGLERDKTYHHMNGLSHNLTLLQNGEKITYHPKMLLSYLRSCTRLQIPLPIDFFPLYERFKDTL